eukprot:1153800-Pelagomonas_calceolata.AAC.2
MDSKSSMDEHAPLVSFPNPPFETCGLLRMRCSICARATRLSVLVFVPSSAARAFLNSVFT